jgi:hypothetical protein
MSLYCAQNPEYMKDGFQICLESWHKDDDGKQENVRLCFTVLALFPTAIEAISNWAQVHGLSADLLAKRQVVYIDITEPAPPKVRFCFGLLGSWMSILRLQEYKPEHDPTKFRSTKASRGPFVSGEWQV